MDFKVAITVIFVAFITNMASIGCGFAGALLAYEGKSWWWVFLIFAVILHSSVQLPVHYEEVEVEEEEAQSGE
jgi:hypothetical protein